MSITLRMADGDLYIDPETGRGEEISGADKADQDLADLYLTDYDSDRNWGSDLSVEKIGIVRSPDDFQTMLFLRLSQANQRILAKQSRDQYLTTGEQITGFSNVNVGFDPDSQNAYFLSVADLASGGQVEAGGEVTFKPVSLKHIVPPPADIVIKIIQ
jgi:hypothetical protein